MELDPAKMKIGAGLHRHLMSLIPHAALTLSLVQFSHIAMDNNHLRLEPDAFKEPGATKKSPLEYCYSSK